MAEQYPDLVRKIPKEGSELACHRYTHARFDLMEKEEVKSALKKAGKILRRFDQNLVSFRAPNLKFPGNYLKLLEEGFLYDSSLAAYKPPFPRIRIEGKLIRIPAMITSSVIRLLAGIFIPLLKHTKDPVIFVHPWEFVDMSRMPVRPDCKLNTGKKALENLKTLIHISQAKNCLFLTLEERAKLETCK